MATLFAFVPFLLAILVWLGIAIGGGYVVLRFLRAYESRGAEPQRLVALTNRVHALEQTLEQLETSVGEIAEAQRFTTRLLTERAGDRQSGPPRGLPAGDDAR